MSRGAAAELSIAMLGTRGVPARYGGFETAVEEVGRRLADRGHRVVVYSRPTDHTDAGADYLGMQRVELPVVRKRSLETLLHTGLSAGHLLRHRTDVAFLFNCANAPWLPLLRLRRIPVATHVDGLEWQRGKWGTTGRRYYQFAEKLAVRGSDALIADAAGIADYYRGTHAAGTVPLSYGAPVVSPDTSRLAELDLTPGGYHLVVARFEPENHVDEIVAGYRGSTAELPLVVVGSAPYSDAYTAAVRASADERVRFLGGVWDQQLLDALYVGARSYLHGHSVGGTNPSLLRAIGAGTAVSAWDVNFNREVLGEAGHYFDDLPGVAAAVEQAEADEAGTAARAARSALRATDYNWDDVADGYERLAFDLAARRLPRPRRLGG